MRAYVNRGSAYSALGRHAEALADHDAAIRIDPNIALGYYNRGVSYLPLGSSRRVPGRLQHASHPDRSQHRPGPMSLWASSIASEDWDDALQAFETAERLGDPTGTENAALMREHLGLPAEPADADDGQQAFEAFLGAEMPGALRRALERHPLLALPDFLALVEHAFTEQAPPGELPALWERLDQLRQLIPRQVNP